MFTDRTTNRSDQAAAVEFAYDVAQFWDRHLGQRLFGVYLIGSLAHGGFSAQYSDIDMALIAAGPWESGEIDLVFHKVVARSAALSSKLSLFWTDQYFSVGRFPPLDRID
jgi:predicted nucleotidyltransferase